MEDQEGIKIEPGFSIAINTSYFKEKASENTDKGTPSKKGIYISTRFIFIFSLTR